MNDARGMSGNLLVKGSPLPDGWTFLAMDDVGRWFGGGTPSKANPRFWTGGSIPWVSPKDMKVELINDAQDHITEDAVEQSTTNLVEAGSVLIVSRSGILQHTLPVAVTQRQVALNQDLKAVSPRENVRSDYLALALKAFEREILHTCTKTGTTVQSLEWPTFLRFQIPIAPLLEQERIVAEVEKQFTRLEAGVAALRRVQANLRRYRAAILKSACEGRFSPKEASLWKSTTIGQVLTAIEAGRSFKCEERPPTQNEVGVVKVSAVTWGIYNEQESKTCHDASRIEERFLVRPDDFLFSRANTIELIGACVIAKHVSLRVMLSDKILRFKFTPDVLPSWILYWLRSQFGRSEIERLATGNQVSMRNIGQDCIRQIKIKLPPLHEQIRIVAELERRLSVVDELEGVVSTNLQRARRLRYSTLRKAVSGNLLAQNILEEPAKVLFDRIRGQWEQKGKVRPPMRRKPTSPPAQQLSAMKALQDPKSSLEYALAIKPEILAANELFGAGSFEREQIYSFYDAIADSSEAIKRLSVGRHATKVKSHPLRKPQKSLPPLRLHELWVKKFKNLEEYLVTFDPKHALDVVLGWNGTGKSNLFEVLIVIFRDLHKWQTKDKWTPQEGLDGYRIRYEIGGRIIEINWEIDFRRPVAKVANQRHKIQESDFQICKREEIPLPHFVFGYYSGPSNRFAELFSEPKQDHYERLLKQKADDEETLASLLEQRRFFNAETHHAKYALLSFFYQDDPGIRHFLKKHLRIEDLESVLFVLKRPRWHRNTDPEDFWGAKGLLRPVLERLRKHSIAPMVLPQTVDDGFQEGTRDHYFLLLPTKKHLQALASEYADPTSFFVALESTDFSSIIHEVRIRVRIDATSNKQTVVTFKEMSEGEQQLLMVLGLLRFTKMNQSLVLLDEPDTHLNPHWQLGFLHLLLEALVGNASDRKSQNYPPIEELEKRLTSQVLLSTHDPLAIAGLLKQNIHLLKRRDKTEECLAVRPDESPRGMGFTGILTSEMFGLKSDLDDVTLNLLDKHAALVGKKTLSPTDKKELTTITAEVERMGFKSASSDPYYRAYLQALARRRKTHDIFAKSTWNKEDIDNLGKETDEILKEIEQEDADK